ncbi:aspartate aminotransferase family protein, partial [Streptomyces swartbergensis]
LMIGMEFVDPEGETRTARRVAEAAGTPLPAAPELAAAVQRECLRRGLIVGLGGRHSSVVRLLPPLTITDEQAVAVQERLADAVRAAARCDVGGAAAPFTP